MQSKYPIRCRVAACREAQGDDHEWNFFIINDSEISLDLVLLYEIGYEWGNLGDTEVVDVSVTDLAPGTHALIWRDDGSGAELRMEISLRVQARGREVLLQFEFPKLYHKRNLQMVDELGKPGWQVTAES